MCKAPNTLADGTQVACRRCSLCIDRAINDWVGRNIAESKTAVGCNAVTLTYGRNSAGDADHASAVILTYSDVQKYLKLLRRHGYPVRYHVTGEYGTLKGRAHWHIMLYWLEQVPEHVLEQNFMEPHWGHGWSFWTEPSFHAIRYNCKYIMKDNADGRQGHLAMSKKPPLGTQYFRELAEEYVRQGLAPQTQEYKFAGVERLKKDGSRETIPFWLKGRPLEMFLDHFIATWRRTYPGKHWPNSALVDLYYEFGRVVGEERATERMVADRAADLKFERLQEQAQREAEKPRVLRFGPRDSEQWWNRYVKDASYEQERQRRQAEFERWQQQQADDWAKRFTAQFWDSEEYKDDVRSAVAGSGGVQGLNEWFREYTRPEPGNVADKPDYGNGKIGTWNASYPREAEPRAGQGAGPGKASHPQNSRITADNALYGKNAGKTKPDAKSSVTGSGARNW